MTNCSIESPTTFAEKAQLLLEAQAMATSAALAGNLAGQVESVPVSIIAVLHGEWSFTVSCVMSCADLEYNGDPGKRVVDLLMTGVPVERLQRAVELTIERARAQIARHMERQQA